MLEDHKDLLFVDNSNIDASCLNRGKLHLNRQGTYIYMYTCICIYMYIYIYTCIYIIYTQTCIYINPNTSNEADFRVTLRLNRSKYSRNIIFSHLNINSIRNKFENLKEPVSNHVDILVI